MIHSGRFELDHRVPAKAQLLWEGCDIDKPRNLAKSVTVE